MLHSLSAFLVFAGFAAAYRNHTCPYASFKLTNPFYREWATGQYMTALNDQFYFGTNDSSKAQIYTLDTSNGRVFRDGNSFAFWQGILQGHDAQVRFQSPAYVATQQHANYITCQVPKANGDTFACQGDNSGLYGQWDSSWGNQNAGSGGLALVEGNATGPYPQPHPSLGWVSIGGVRVQVEDLHCGNAPTSS